MLRNIPYIPSFFRAFITNGCWILSKAFSVSIAFVLYAPFFFVLASVLYAVLHLWIYVG
jgi:hypothetical protein